MTRPIHLFVCFLIPFVLLLIGAVSAGVYGFREIPQLLDETARGMVPKGFVVRLEDPGKYTVWLHERGSIGVDFYRGSDQLPPGGSISVYDVVSGREIEVKKWMNSTKTIGHERAVSLGSFVSDKEEQNVEIKGSGISKPVLIAVSRANTARVIGVVCTLLGIVLVALVLSIGAFLWLLHRRKLANESGVR